MFGRRGFIATLAGFASACVLAPSAMGSQVEVIDGELVVSGSAGEANDLVVESGTSLTVTDEHPIEPGSGCVSTSATSVRCDAVVARISIAVGDEDDVVRIDESVSHLIAASIEGDAGDDKLYGAGANDRVAGGPGDDVADGGGGDDVLTIDEGVNDRVGGAGSDTIDASGLDVTFYGDLDDEDGWGSANAYKHGPLDFRARDRVAGVENVTGSSGHTSFYGSDQPNRFRSDPDATGADLEAYGEGGDDVITVGSAGTGLADPGPGDDIVRATGGADVKVTYGKVTSGIVVDLLAGTAIAEGTDQLSGIHSVQGSPHGDRLLGSESDDSLGGGDGDDTIILRGGADTAGPGAGDDSIDGGSGADAADYSERFGAPHTSVDINLTADLATGRGTDGLASVENVVGSANADRIEGDSGPNVIDGSGSGDELIGHGGNDVIADESWENSVSGGLGDDDIRVGALGTSEGGDGDDTMATDGSGVMFGGPGDDDLTGSSDFLTIIAFSDSVSGVRVSLEDGVATGEGTDTLHTIKRVQGTEGDDEIIGSDGSEYLEGMGGNDSISGGEGWDRLMGGAGNDDLVDVGAATYAHFPDSLEGGPGDDLLTGGDATETLDPGAGEDTINAGGGREHINTRDGEVDVVDCGGGVDVHLRELLDEVTDNCEYPDLPGPPPIVLTSGPEEGDVVPPGTVHWTFDLGDSVHVTCMFDIGPFNDCIDGDFKVTAEPGPHLLRIRARDTEGEETALTFWFTVSEEAPARPTLNDAPPRLSAVGSAGFSVADEGHRLECGLDGAELTTCPNGEASYRRLTSGEHSFRYRFVGGTGLTGETATYRWTVERGPTEITERPDNRTARSSARFAFNDVGFDNYACTLDGNAVSGCRPERTEVDGLGHGTHTFTVAGRDANGDLTRPASFEWSVDSKPPQTTITPGSVTSRSRRVVLRADAIGGAREIRCEIDREVRVDCSGRTFEVRLSPGRHTVAAVAIDAVGNEDPTPAVSRIRVVDGR